jgi:hypothetical protein
VPLYVETNPAIQIAGVYLYYRTDSDAGFQMMEMGRAGPGFYAEIGCTMIQPTRWFYYLAVVDMSGNVIGGDGTPDRPFTVNMSSTGLLGPAPMRPDGSAVPSCGANGESPETADCPPGISCHGIICEHSCAIASDCSSGESCILGCCKVPVEEEEEEDQGPTDWSAFASYERPGIGLWLHLSVGLGVGAFADGSIKEPLWFTDATGTWYGPDDARHGGTNRSVDRQVAPVDAGFALSGFAMRFGIGYNVLPFLSLELNYRFSAPFDLDNSKFPWLVEARIAWWLLTGPTHMVSVFLGGGAGIVTYRIPRVVFNQELGDPPSKVLEPAYRLSGYGALALGSQYRYCFNDTWAIGAELATNVMVGDTASSFSWNFDFLFDATVMF